MSDPDDTASTAHETTCHCGAVKLRIGQRPDYMNQCNCSLCAKTAGIWGYFPPDEVSVLGETSSYTRSDIKDPSVRLQFCPRCGVTTHWTATEAFKVAHPDIPPRMGVNMRLFDDDAKQGVELRFPDGAAWDGESDYGYVKESVVL